MFRPDPLCKSTKRFPKFIAPGDKNAIRGGCCLYTNVDNNGLKKVLQLNITFTGIVFQNILLLRITIYKKS